MSNNVFYDKLLEWMEMLMDMLWKGLETVPNSDQSKKKAQTPNSQNSSPDIDNQPDPNNINKDQENKFGQTPKEPSPSSGASPTQTTQSKNTLESSIAPTPSQKQQKDDLEQMNDLHMTSPSSTETNKREIADVPTPANENIENDAPSPSSSLRMN